MNKIITYIILFFISNTVLPQQINLDSLLSKAKTDSQYANAYCKIGISYIELENVKAIDNFDKALIYANKTHNFKLIGDIKTEKARAYMFYIEYDKAKYCLNAAYLDYFKISAEAEIAKVYKKLGAIEYYKKAYITAYKHWNEALNIFIILNDKLNIAKIHNNIALIHNQLEEPLESIKHLKIASKIFKELDEKNMLVATYLNLGISYLKPGKYNESEDYFKKVLYLYKILNDEHGIMTAHTNFAAIYLDTKRYKESLNSSFKALEICKKTNNIKKTITIYSNISSAYFILEKYDNSLNYAFNGLQLANEKQLLYGQVEFNERIYQIYEKQNLVERSKKYKEIYLVLNDSLKKIQNIEKLKTLTKEHKTIVEPIYIDSTKTIVTTEKQKEKIGNYYYLIIASIFILLIVVFLIIKKRK